jgi:hypothetical protein
MHELLGRAGFRIRRNRADCMHCEGRSQFTVSFTDSVAFCHRCKWTANVRSFGSQLGLTVAPESLEHRRTRLAVARFQAWLSDKYSEMADQERLLASKALLAKKVLARFPDCEPAWGALARWRHAEHRLQGFFDLAQCRSGRLELFKGWLKASGITS